MIALKTNGQWDQVTLNPLRKAFPNVSFRRTIEQEGQSWDVEGVTYEAVLIIETTMPAFPNEAGSMAEGPLEDFNGVPRQTWVWTTAPPPSTEPRDYILTAGQFEYLLVDAELDDALETVKGATKANRGSSPEAKESEAMFKLALKGTEFNFDATLGLVTVLAEHIPGGLVIDEAFLTPFWLKAASKW